MVQTSKVELVIGHRRCDFRYVLIKKLGFLNCVADQDKKKKAGVVLSQNVVTACTLLNCHNLPCVVPVTCLTFHL